MWIKLLWIWLFNYLFELLLLILWGIYPAVGFLNHMVVLFYIFWWIAKLVYIAVYILYSLPAACKGFNFSTLSLTLTMFCFVCFIIAILSSIMCYHCGFEGKSFLRVMVELNSGVCAGFEEERRSKENADRIRVYKKHTYFAFRNW